MGNFVADPKKRWPKGIVPFEFEGSLDGYKSPFDIAASVGVGGTNASADVKRVQELLNRFDPADGGPMPRLVVDGYIGPKTVAAINKFQTAHFGWQDGRVDPGGPTIVELTIADVDPNRDQGKAVILNAVHQWNRQLAGTLKWVRRTVRDDDWVAFRDGTFNNSKSVGRKGKRQVVEISIPKAALLNGWFGGTREGVVIHEMAHAAGLGHEHQRSDRDRFVRIVTANVGRPCDFRNGPAPELGCPFPFTPCVTVEPYDYCSTMHYFSTQGANPQGRTTIEAIDSSGSVVKRPMGSLDGLQPGDLATLRKFYP